MNDTERLDWLIAQHAMVGEGIPIPITFSKVYWVIFDPFNAASRGPEAKTPREAIDKAMGK